VIEMRHAPKGNRRLMMQIQGTTENGWRKRQQQQLDAGDGEMLLWERRERDARLHASPRSMDEILDMLGWAPKNSLWQVLFSADE